MAGRVYIVGTHDTKHAELDYLEKLIAEAGLGTVSVDISTAGTDAAVDASAEEVAAHHPAGRAAVLGLGPGHCRARDVAGARGVPADPAGPRRGHRHRRLGRHRDDRPAMRALAVGVPKLLVSTVASGNVAPYVGPSDITMMYSGTDLAGLNSISRRVLGNAAHAIAGMVRHQDRLRDAGARPTVGLTMFGVTTPCVTQVTHELEGAFDCLVFHATGTGGQSLEKLVESRLIGGAIDITTTEVVDFLVGGVFPCTEDRFGAFARTGTPYVGSCGALDMVNFGAPDTIPETFRSRRFYEHNPQVTLMRTTPEECRQAGEWIGGRLNRCEGPVRFFIPEGGVSAIDAPSQPFWDPEADEALFAALEQTIRQTRDRQVIRLPHHINDPLFADALRRSFLEISQH